MDDKKKILEVKDITTCFRIDGKEVQILKNVSFDLYKGSVLGIVGESGCGKSITALTIMNLLPKNAYIKSGEVNFITDEKIFNLHKLKKYGREFRSLRGSKISMIFQDPVSSINPVYRVGDQIAEALHEHFKISKAEARDRAIKMLEKLGMPDADRRVDDYPHQFSGGMKQRVTIAAAMICNPDVIIADEPTTAIDVTAQAQIMELMKDLQRKENKSIILITHNMGLVAEMTDYVAVMYMGRIVEYGKTKDVLTNPYHPYTKALIRSIPVLGKVSGARLASIPGSPPAADDIKVGCEFSNRCDVACEMCQGREINNIEIGDEHFVRCVRYYKGRDNSVDRGDLVG